MSHRKLRSSRRTFLKGIGVAGVTPMVAGCTSSLSGGEDWPPTETETVTIGPPGSGFDILMRETSIAIQENIDIDFIPNNMPGGAGELGANYLFTDAEPDGKTTGLINPSTLIRHQISNGVEYELNEFEWLPRVAQDVGAIGVHADSDIQTWDDFVTAYNNHEIQLGTTGPTGSWSTYVAMLAQLSDELDLQPLIDEQVAYGGTPEAISALESGEIQANPNHLSNLVEWAEEGIVRILMVYSTTEEIPSYAEHVAGDAETLSTAGIDNAEQIASSVNYQRTWAAPPETPEDRVQFWEEQLLEVYEDEEFQSYMLDNGFPIEPASRDEVVSINESLTSTWEEHIDLIDRLQG